MNVQETGKHIFNVGSRKESEARLNNVEPGAQNKSRRLHTQREGGKAPRHAASRKNLLDQSNNQASCKDLHNYSKKFQNAADLKDSRFPPKSRGAPLAHGKDPSSRPKQLKSHKKAPQVIDDTPIGQVMEIVKDSTKTPREDKNASWAHEYLRKQSAQEDVVDEIYLEKDPIATSLKQRKKDGGHVLSVVRGGDQSR